jgi:hypothetical protein
MNEMILFMFIVTLVLFVISILTLIFTIIYLGPGFNRSKKILLNDWRRKWLLFFAWFTLIGSSVSLLTTFVSVARGENQPDTTNNIVSNIVANILLICTNVFIITYIGPTFNRQTEIKVDDFRRKWVLFFAWFNSVTLLIILIMFLVGSVCNSSK